MAVYKIFGMQPSRFRVVSGTAFADVPISGINSFTVDPNIEELTFEGEGARETVPLSAEISGTVTVSKFATDWLASVAGVTAVATGLPGDTATRYYPEQGTYPYVQMEIDIRAQDDTTGAEEKLRLVVFKAKLQNPLTLSDIGNLEATTQEFAWSSVGTAEDLLGTALPGVPSGSVHYSIDVLV